MKALKALTLWRPWPAAIIHGGKRVENRTWTPPREMLGQDIAIHAGLRVDDGAVRAVRFSGSVGADLLPGPTGIVAVVRLVGWIDERTHPRTCAGVSAEDARCVANSVWFDGPVGWVIDTVRPLAEPVPCRGAQGLWTVPDEVAAAVAFATLAALREPLLCGRGGAA